mgnify:CR=1 FL=1
MFGVKNFYQNWKKLEIFIPILLLFIKKRNFLVDYSNIFVKYSNENDNSKYDYLITNLDQAQSALGAYGFASVSRPNESFYRN